MHGERKGYDLARRAIEQLGEDDPLVQELLAMLLAVARGETGYKGRYIGDRLRAIRELLDRRLGRAHQAVSVDQKGELRVKVEYGEPSD